MKIKLSNGCSHSKLSVNPSNWESKSAKLNKDWFISYRFYDPQYLKPKQVMIKGMNAFKLLQERQDETRKLIEKEQQALKSGYNPFFKESNVGLIDKCQPATLAEALDFAFKKVSVSERTKKDLSYTIKKAVVAATSLGFQQLAIENISRKHIKLILDAASKTADSFNKNRSNLMILFEVLCELEVVQHNNVRDIKKKKVIKKIRQVLTLEERKLINKYLQRNYPSFYNFLNIFFHSGARISELMKVRAEQVDIENQRFKVLILKGTQYQEVWKVIKDIAKPYWIEALKDAGKEDYLFSKGLKAGKTPIKSYQIDKRWYRLVKKKLGITADFYSLKHLHTTEVAEMLSEVEAAIHNSHTTTSMVKNVYDVNNKTRKESGIKQLQNKFA